MLGSTSWRKSMIICKLLLHFLWCTWVQLSQHFCSQTYQMNLYYPLRSLIWSILLVSHAMTSYFYWSVKVSSSKLSAQGVRTWLDFGYLRKKISNTTDIFCSRPLVPQISPELDRTLGKELSCSPLVVDSSASSSRMRKA